MRLGYLQQRATLSADRWTATLCWLEIELNFNIMLITRDVQWTQDVYFEEQNRNGRPRHGRGQFQFVFVSPQFFSGLLVANICFRRARVVS